MQKSNIKKFMSVIAVLSPMVFSSVAFGQDHQIGLKSHTLVQDQTYLPQVEELKIQFQAKEEEEKIKQDQREKDFEVIQRESIAIADSTYVAPVVVPLVDETAKEKQEVLKIITEAPQKTELDLSDGLKPSPDAVEVTGLDMSQSVFAIEEELKKDLASVDSEEVKEKEEKIEIITELPVREDLDLSDGLKPSPDAVEVTGLDNSNSFAVIQEELNEALGRVTPTLDNPTGQDLSEAIIVDESNEYDELNKVICDQKDQIAELTKSIEELKETATAPVDRMDEMYKMMQQLMVMNQMSAMQPMYPMQHSGYDMMNEYMKPMREMSAIMFGQQRLMMADMYSNAPKAFSPTNSNVYNVTGDYYAGDYSKVSTQNPLEQVYQTNLPESLTPNYVNFGSISEAPRSEVKTTSEVETKSEESKIDVPSTGLNDLSDLIS